jgi:hypothetical protein
MLKPHLFSVAVPGYGPFHGNDQGDGPCANGNHVRFGALPDQGFPQNQMGGCPRGDRPPRLSLVTWKARGPMEEGPRKCKFLPSMQTFSRLGRSELHSRRRLP